MDDAQGHGRYIHGRLLQCPKRGGSRPNCRNSSVKQKVRRKKNGERMISRGEDFPLISRRWFPWRLTSATECRFSVLSKAGLGSGSWDWAV